MATERPANPPPASPNDATIQAGPHETSLTTRTIIAEGAAVVRDEQQTLCETTSPVESTTKTLKRIGAYEILSELGRGGMGVVYKAQDQRLKRTVALKVILAGGHAGEVELARFQTEAEAVARLKHPNFVQIYEVGTDEGLPFLALEYCGGGNLEDRVAASPLPPDEAAALMAKLADAMDHAHRAMVIHRDLKPANILFDENGEPRITDFGLAKKVGESDSNTKTISVMGSLGYMSPEQASGQTRNATPAVDIYALGATLYRLLTGKTPFEGASAAESLRLIIDGVPTSVRRSCPACPRDLDTICMKCLEKSPAGRYPTAAALADDLRRFLRGEPIAARAATPIEQLMSWARRNPLPTLTAVGAIVMLALLATGMAWTTYRNYCVIEEIQNREMRVQELRGQILFLDEVLTSSCSLAAVTGESRWEERYRHFLPELDIAINEAASLVPQAEEELATVGDANGALVRTEEQAFALVRQHQKSAAWDLLKSEEYFRNKQVYAEGLSSFSNRLLEHSEAVIRSARQEAMRFLIASICLGGMVLLILFFGSYSLLRVLRAKSSAHVR